MIYVLVIRHGVMPIHIEKLLPDSICIIYMRPDEIDDLDSFDLLIILGGMDSIALNTYPYLDKMRSILGRVKIPVIGFCLGCQLIAWYYGCHIYRLQGLVVGCDANLELVGCRYTFRYHEDAIRSDGKIEVLEEIDGVPYLIMKDNMLGIQCHPEISLDGIRELCDKIESPEIEIWRKFIVSYLRKFYSHI